MQIHQDIEKVKKLLFGVQPEIEPRIFWLLVKCSYSLLAEEQ